MFGTGNETGWVYAPTKSLTSEGRSTDKNDGVWTKYHFEWPRQRKQLIEHITKYRNDHDVFISPALYKEAGGTKADQIKGSFCFWVDFDGKVPTEADLVAKGIPAPTLRNQSSIEDREHWFWRSPNFVTELFEIQDTNKALTYALEGDLGGWYAHKVLRPVSGINHKRDVKTEVSTLSHTAKFYPVQAFADVPVPKAYFSELDFNPLHVPSFFKVVAKYSFTDPDVIDLMAKGVGDMGNVRRSDALTRLGFECAEMGMTNEEIYSILVWKDGAWGKYRDRPDPTKEYINLVNYIRQRKPQHEQHVKTQTEGLGMMGWRTFVETTEDIKWFVEGILPATGLIYVAGPPGSGKTLLTIEWCRNMALGKPMFGWKTVDDRPLKVMYLSLEMPGSEAKEFVDRFTPKDSAELQMLEENFVIYAKTDPIEFYKPMSETIIKLVGDIQKFRPDILLIDSATVSLASELTVEKEVKESLKWLNRIRHALNFAVIFVAHTKKEQGSKPVKMPTSGYNPKRLSDLFGSVAVAAAATTVISMVRDEDRPGLHANVGFLKSRFKGASESFEVQYDGIHHTFLRPARPMEPVMSGNVPPPVADEPKPKGFDAFSF
jgi:KaiC/GvpD/RAD55 family RecA-like ATPase